MNPFRSLRDYETFIYALLEQFSSLQQSTLVIAQRGPRFAILQGAITWANGYRLTVREQLTLEDGPVVIEFYGYIVSSIGTIRRRIPMIQAWLQPIRIINMCHQTSNIIAFQPPV